MHESISITQDHVNTLDQESVTSAGYQKCLHAYLEWSDVKQPLVAKDFSKLKTYYELMPKVLRGRSEFYEIKQIIDKSTGDFRAVKIYRKAELS